MAVAGEQVGDEGAILLTGDRGVKDAAQLAGEGGVVPGLGEDQRPGDDLAAGVELAPAQALAGLVELTAGGELGR